MTKCTVARETLPPARNAGACGSSPGNDGSSDGWIFSIFPYQRCTNPAVNSFMKPPRQINSTLCSSNADCSTASNAARSLPNGLLSMVTVATPFSRAVARPPASARLEITSTISAGKSAGLAALISAAMLESRPEIRMATRRFVILACQIEVTVIDHAVAVFRLDDLTEQRDSLAGLGEHLAHRFDRVRFDDRDHADAAIKRSQQFEFGDAALRRQPFEHRQHRQPRQIDADAEMLWQHARDVVGKAAAGDMGEPLDRIGLADRAQAGANVKFCRRQQRAAERHDRRERRLGIKGQAGLGDDLAHQRKAVGMHARRGEANHRVAGLDIAARQQRAAFGGADRKAAEVVIAVLVEPWHFGGLAPDQRTAGFPATLGDA